MNKKTEVDNIIDTNYLDLPNAKDLYREFIKQSNIEKYKEERFVLSSLMQGKKYNEINSELRIRHPDVDFNKEDFERFLERNREVTEYLKHGISTVARRFNVARADVEMMMRDLMLFNKEVVRDLAKKEDATNLVAAIRALNQTVMNYAKLAGFLEESESKQPINIVNVISDKYEGSRLKDRIHRADFKDDVIVISEENE